MEFAEKSVKTLILGSDGRAEIYRKTLEKSPLSGAVFMAPGNGGTPKESRLPFGFLGEDFHKVARFIEENEIDLLIPSPEIPIVNGIVNYLDGVGAKTRILAPNKETARLEGSKKYCVELCKKLRIPTPETRYASDWRKAKKIITEWGAPIVVKADGLAQGKGVEICETTCHAEHTAWQMLQDRKFGEAGKTVLFQKKIAGSECSFIGVADGKNVVMFQSALDYKHEFDGGKGKMTGGMGAISPHPRSTKEVVNFVKENFTIPLVRSTGFRGIIYVQLMATESGWFLIEVNVRGGDPEMQAILPRLKSDFLKLALCASIQNGLQDYPDLEWSDDAGAYLVLAKEGYPGEYETNIVVEGAEKAEKFLSDNNGFLIHSGTKIDENNELKTAGGRVLGIGALSKDIRGAKEIIYEGAELITFGGKEPKYRRDIGSF